MSSQPNLLDNFKFKGPVIRFESAEHECIGDKILLRYDSGSITGKDFKYTVKKNTLSYGLIVALAGDFYANWTKFPGDVEQISDKWDSDRESSIRRALKNAEYLSSDEGGYLTAILSTMLAEEQEVRRGIPKGQDVAQIYTSIGDKYDKQYFLDTYSGYGWIAQCNWDHFGKDAVNAYSAVHTAALRRAKLAHDSTEQSQIDANLKEAYFLEAFAQHFLTDLFSSGHLRTPRRILHQNLIKEPKDKDPGDGPEAPNFEVYPADRCAQKMHNEDCANGLWVTNQLGESWAAYGDKQLWSGKSARNFLQAVKAAQVGVTEVWETRETGNIPLYSNYKALKMVPILDKLYSTNFVPLFRWDILTPDVLFYRADLDQRNDFNVTSIPAKESFSAWKSIMNKISESGQDKDMYPFTKSFLSPTSIWHIREMQRPGSNMIQNNYGPVDSGTYGSYWSMSSQSISPFPEVVGTMKWVTATMLNYGVRSLVGRFKAPNSNKYSTHHLGLKINKSTPSMDVVWSTSVPNDNSFWTAGDVTYAKYSQDSGDLGMIKYWTNGPQGASKLELWCIPAALDDAPVKQNLKWDTNALNFIFPYQMQSNDTFMTFVGYGFQPSISTTTWYFSTWTNGYSHQSKTVYQDFISFPAQALLPGKFGTDDNGYRLVRIFYGPTFPTKDHIQIDILHPSRDSTGQIKFDSKPITQTFSITWGANLPTDYLTWFLVDVDNDNFLDLVALTVSSDLTQINVIVFPGLSNFTFGSPVISNINITPEQGTLLTAKFMTPILASRARFTYSKTTASGGAITSSAAILALFDNYGILGARMLAPVTPAGTLVYELKGQTPAIAGQPSQSLGLTDVNWMGRGERPQGIGFLLE